MRIYSAVVISTLMNGAETWSITKNQEQRLDNFDTGCLRIIPRIRWWHRKSTVLGGRVVSARDCYTTTEVREIRGSRVRIPRSPVLQTG